MKILYWHWGWNEIFSLGDNWAGLKPLKELFLGMYSLAAKKSGSVWDRYVEVEGQIRCSAKEQNAYTEVENHSMKKPSHASISNS